MDSAQERAVVTWIRRLRPAVMLSHYPQDRHPDHIQASLIVERAWYLAGLIQYAAEGPAFRPKGRWYFASRIGFHPSVVVDVTPTWDAKKAAILAHSSQVVRSATSSRVTALNDPKFLVRIESRLRHFGSMIGVEYGEPFVSDMPLGVDSLASILGSPKPAPGAFTG
jgi:LmbE family N-acetylglucosaminyl deacetylase